MITLFERFSNSMGQPDSLTAALSDRMYGSIFLATLRRPSRFLAGSKWLRPCEPCVQRSGEGAGAAISQHLVFHGRFCDLQGPPFFSIDATNENDETLHVKTCYSAWEKQDAAWIKGQLKETLANVTHLAGLSQDTAAVCKAAFKQLQGELGPDQPRCFYIDCNEHVSQLLAQDLARALPWMKD